MTPSPETIAKGLSEAQRRLFARMSPYPGASPIHRYKAGGQTLGSIYALWKRGLVETSEEFTGPDAWERGDWGYVALTPLGLAVRQYLESQHD